MSSNTQSPTLPGDSFAASVKNLTKSSFSSEDARAEAVLSVRALLYQIESPAETFFRWCWEQPCTHACLKVAYDLQVFELLDSSDSDGQSTLELADKTSSDPFMLANHIIRELAADRYALTETTSSMVNSAFLSAIPGIYKIWQPGVINIPEFLAKNGYQCPSDGMNCPWQVGASTSKPLFDTIQSDPHTSAVFNDLMVGLSKLKPDLWTTIPVEERILNGAKGEGHPVIVDVGGSVGHDVKEFKRSFPHAQGQIMVQDTRKVLESTNWDAMEGIDALEHDFFTPQPIKGARVYLLHQILHDWPFPKARSILLNLKSALEKGYSKILACDIVLPSKGAHPRATATDITMMGLCGSSERTEQMWHELVESAGLKIVQIHTKPTCIEAVVEIEL